MKHLWISCAIILAGLVTSVHAKIVTEEVSYQSGKTVMKGYIAYNDKSKDKKPGILVVHEWWGHNNYARKRTRMLAKLGYVALAIDMYGDGKQAGHPDDAGKFSKEIMSNLPEAQARFEAALSYLKENKMTDPTQTAAIGYCFGGGVVLHMARLGVNLKGVVSFHGSLAGQIKAEKDKVKTRVLVCHGADDKFITTQQITAFKKEMEEANVDYQFFSYPGALHSFTNPQADEFSKKFNIPVGYNKQADKKSWKQMQKFFKNIFK